MEEDQAPPHPHLFWALSVFAACASAGIEQLPAGVSRYTVGPWALTINNSGQVSGDLPAWRIVVETDGFPASIIDPSTVIFEADELAFLADMRAVLPEGHHLKVAGE